jgi:hypothetical protein
MKISVNVQKIKNYLNGPSPAWVNIYGSIKIYDNTNCWRNKRLKWFNKQI